MPSKLHFPILLHGFFIILMLVGSFVGDHDKHGWGRESIFEPSKTSLAKTRLRRLDGNLEPKFRTQKPEKPETRKI